MKKIYTLVLAALVAMSIVGCTATEAVPAKPKKVQNVQVFSAPNTDGKLTTKSIEAGFDAAKLSIAGNNDMNKPFAARFGKLHYKVYNLAMFVKVPKFWCTYSINNVYLV